MTCIKKSCNIVLRLPSWNMSFIYMCSNLYIFQNYLLLHNMFSSLALSNGESSESKFILLWLYSWLQRPLNSIKEWLSNKCYVEDTQLWHDPSIFKAFMHKITYTVKATEQICLYICSIRGDSEIQTNVISSVGIL